MHYYLTIKLEMHELIELLIIHVFVADIYAGRSIKV